jgi:hypothetical protein
MGSSGLGGSGSKTSRPAPALLQNRGQRLLIDDRTPCAVDEKCRWLHQSEPPCIDEMSCLRSQRTIERNEIGLAKDSIEVHEPYPEFGGEGRVDERIMRNELHAERLGETKDLRSDVADADRSQHPVDQADSVMIEALVETLRTLARQLVFDK